MSKDELKTLERKLAAERERELERGIAKKRDWIAEERLRSLRAHLPPHEVLLGKMERQLESLRNAA